MTLPVDEPRPLRADDALDVGAVVAFLRRHMPGLDSDPVVTQFRGGASNLTYLLSWPGQELVIRRPPAGTKAASAHDMGREVAVLRALAPVYPKVPRVLAYNDDPSVAGGTFYAMQRLRGVILRQDLPPDAGLDAAATRRVCDAVLDELATLHDLDVHTTGLVGLGRGEGYVRRQIEGWSRRYRAAMTDDAASFEGVMAWLAAHQPADAGHVLLHGDFRFDNVVLDPGDPTRVVGVLDWEMATVGCPLMDVGNSLAYWVEPGDDEVLQLMRRQPTNAPGMRTRAEVWAWYTDKTGRGVDDPRFYEVYGLFRLAVILQQIWLRVVRGQSNNPQFQAFGFLARHLEGVCEARIRTK